jgi:hypothetical protein
MKAAALTAIFLASLTASATAIPSLARANETVIVCDVYGDQVAPAPAGIYGIGATATCPGDDNPGSYSLNNPPGGMALWTGANNTVPEGASVHWGVTAPAGMTIASVYIPHMYSQGIDDNEGWGGGFFWSGGSSNVNTFDGESGWSSQTASGPSFTWPGGGTPYFGWQIVCGVSSCSNGGDQWLSVELLELNMQETAGPTLNAPAGLWDTSGWVRGVWPLEFSGDSPSGVCTLEATLGGQSLPESKVTPNQAVWHQCSAPAVNVPVDTTGYGPGQAQLVLGATDAADQSAFLTKTIDIDNEQPTLSLSGPTDAPSTAGTQYVTATAGAGPSGVAGISCSVDGSPAQWYPQASVAIPIQSVGTHQVSCFSENNAHDASGTPATSPTESWTLTIRSPSVSTVSFARVADALRCHSTHEWVRVPARWVTVYHGGQPIKVKLAAERRRVKVVHCHPRVIRRRIRVHGKWRAVKAIVLPHEVLVSNERVRHGSAATVSGWLGTTDGNALGDQAVGILTIPTNGTSQIRQIETVTTAPNGTWTARIPPGPSRLVEAGYAGGPTVEPTTSSSAHLIVPASVSLRLHPRKTHWGGRIRIRGRLQGGYVPKSGELVVLWIGWPGGSTEIGHLYTRPDGRFASKYTFLRGNGTETYHLWATTARESDYPFAPGRSRAESVTVEP